MTNSGKELEQLVKQIEETLLPEGFTVAANERVFDDAGNQLAEVTAQPKTSSSIVTVQL